MRAGAWIARRMMLAIAGLLVLVLVLQAGERVRGAQSRHAAAGEEAFFDCRAGRVQRSSTRSSLLLNLDLGRAADADHRNAARELANAACSFSLS